MFSTPYDARAHNDRLTLAQRLQAALGKQNDLLAALNKAFTCGKETPISIGDSIDIILDVIPRTEAKIRELAKFTARAVRGKD